MDSGLLILLINVTFSLGASLFFWKAIWPHRKELWKARKRNRTGKGMSDTIVIVGAGVLGTAIGLILWRTAPELPLRLLMDVVLLLLLWYWFRYLRKSG